MSKNPKAFRSISEAADEVGVPQHVLRFWETKFDFIAPVKRAGGRRFYRPADIESLQTVRRLLHDDGLTIKGVQRLLKDKGRAAFSDAAVTHVLTDNESAFEHEETFVPTGLNVVHLEAVLSQIEAARSHLETVLRR